MSWDFGRTGLLLALIGLMGCGSSSPTDGGTADSGPRTDAGPTADAGRRTIADIATGDARFTLLVHAAQRAGLVETLAGTGTFTVFAPTNDAFAASGFANEAAIDALTPAQLQGILTYHALGSVVGSSQITPGVTTTLAGFSIVLGTTGGVTINGGNTVTGGANVVTADITADNGVIHVIDRVLLPPDIPALARYAGLTSLLGAVTSAGLADELSAPGALTVFAPTNEAFDALGTPPTGDALTQVLLYHVVGAAVPSTAVPARAQSLATNTYGDNLTLLFDTSSGVRINGGATVVIADARATNGIVHVIDRVLLPMNTVDAATAAGLTGLLGAVSAAAPLSDGTTVAAALSAQAPYTIFAPTNAAFEAASGTIATLSAAQVRDVLLYHVLSPTTFAMPVLAADLPAAATELGTLNGQNVSLDPTVTPPTVEGARIVSTDLVVTNGVIHVIDAVMVPTL
jgi:transforming growth factor-beta-induced protein